MSDKIQEALKHVQALFPSVTQVFYSTDQKWRYCDADFQAPSFDDPMCEALLDISLLEDAVDTVTQFPSAYALGEPSGAYYAVTGRIPFYENETATMQAENREQAVAVFTSWMYDQIFCPDVAAQKMADIEASEGYSIIVESVVKSETEITIS